MGSIKIGEDEYWTIDDLLLANANWNWAISSRGPGKSYQYKKIAFDDWIENGNEFTVLRRYEVEIKQGLMQTYFNDMWNYMLPKLQDKYPMHEKFYIKAYAGEFELHGVSETESGHISDHKIGTIGYYHALNGAMKIKSSAFPKVNKVCYEEAIPTKDSPELSDELKLLLHYVSTIRRRRTDFKVFLWGNAINRDCTLLQEMGINIRELKQGSIHRYTFYGRNDKIKNSVAVELLKDFEQSDESEAYYVFGDKRTEDSIVHGAWETDIYSTFELSEFYEWRAEYAIILEKDYTRLFVYLCTKKDECCMFVSEAEEENQARLLNRIKYITIWDKETNQRWNRFNFKSINAKPIIEVIRQMYNNQLARYTSNYCGCDFESLITSI